MLPSEDRVESVITDHEVFMPFSAGPRGKNVAMAEIRAVTCAVVQQLDMKIADQTSLER